MPGQVGFRCYGNKGLFTSRGSAAAWIQSDLHPEPCGRCWTLAGRGGDGVSLTSAGSLANGPKRKHTHPPPLLLGTTGDGEMTERGERCENGRMKMSMSSWTSTQDHGAAAQSQMGERQGQVNGEGESRAEPRPSHTPSNWTQPVLILLMDRDKLPPHERKRVNGDDGPPEAPEIRSFKRQIEELLSFMK